MKWKSKLLYSMKHQNKFDAGLPNFFFFCFRMVCVFGTISILALVYWNGTYHLIWIYWHSSRQQSHHNAFSIHTEWFAILFVFVEMQNHRKTWDSMTSLTTTLQICTTLLSLYYYLESVMNWRIMYYWASRVSLYIGHYLSLRSWAPQQ